SSGPTTPGTSRSRARWPRPSSSSPTAGTIRCSSSRSRWPARSAARFLGENRSRGAAAPVRVSGSPTPTTASALHELDGQPIRLQMAHVFPGYRTVERLHAGDRWIVDRAVRVADARTVVVKQPTGKLVPAEAHGRLMHELEVLRAVHGPGVIEAFEVIRDGGHAALVVEWFGAQLASWLGVRRFAIDEALDVAAAIARCLTHIHGAGV